MTTVINIKTKDEIKKSAQKIASDLGLSLSAVINAYLRQFVRNKAVYFNIAPTMAPELENLLSRIDYDIQRGKNLSHTVSSEKKLKSHFSYL